SLALLPGDQRPRVLHQAGVKHLEQLRDNYKNAGVQAETVAFVDEMDVAYAQADLVICRSGALTVAELAAAGIGSVLVPFPFAVDNHQTHNARFLCEAGAAVLVQQRELSPRKLADMLLAFTREKLLDMATRARALAKPDAAATVARICITAAG